MILYPDGWAFGYETKTEKLEKTMETIKKLADINEGNRCICVLDRGWIFVGRLTRDEAGINTLSECANIIRWTGGGGIGRVSTDPEAAVVEVAPSAPIKFRDDAMIFCIPVSEDWNE